MISELLMFCGLLLMGGGVFGLSVMAAKYIPPMLQAREERRLPDPLPVRKVTRPRLVKTITYPDGREVVITE